MRLAHRAASDREDSRCPETAPNRHRPIAARKRARMATSCIAANFPRLPGRLPVSSALGFSVQRSSTLFARLSPRPSISARRNRWEASTLQPTLLAMRRIVHALHASGRNRCSAHCCYGRSFAGVVQTGGLQVNVGSIGFRLDRDQSGLESEESFLSARCRAPWQVSSSGRACSRYLPCSGLPGELTIPPFSTSRLDRSRIGYLRPSRRVRHGCCSAGRWSTTWSNGAAANRA